MISVTTTYVNNSFVHSMFGGIFVEKTTHVPDVLTVRELALVLRVGLNTAYRMVREGTIRGVRVGRQYRIPKQAILEYIGQH